MLPDGDAAARRRFAAYADPVEGMRGYIAWSVDSRLAGRSPEKSWSRFDGYPAASADRLAFNRDFWALDVDFSCVSPWNDRFRSQRAGTAVSPVHVVFANHFQLSPGTRVYFVGTDGKLYYRRYLAGLRVGETDLMVGLLDSPLPPAVRPAAILPDDYAAYIGNADKLPVVTFDQKERALVQELWPISTAPESNGMSSRNLKFSSGWHSVGAAVPEPPELAEARERRARFYDHLVKGDSGNPCFLLVGREPILLYTVFSGGPGAGPALQKLRVQLQNAMDRLRPGYTLRTFDFSALFD